jgi:subtilase family serine protease
MKYGRKVAATLPILLAMFSGQAFSLPQVSIIAHPPHRIKLNVPTAFPSGYSPAQMKKGYGIATLRYTGAGQTIAIIDAFDNPNAEADLNVFNTTFGLPLCTTANGCFTKIYASGTPPVGDVDWGVEISLDVQWAHAIAPGAKILLVEAADNGFNSLFDAINVAIQRGATVISMSWGGSEFSDETAFDQTFSAPGIAFTASSGDWGTGVIYPAASPHVLAVGGTTLVLDATGQRGSEVAWSGSGGGLSTVEQEPNYQINLPLPQNPSHLRGVPDVAYNADPNTGVSVYDSYGESGWLIMGGTSAGAPQWAGFIALAKSGASTNIVNINNHLYRYARRDYSYYYHDITSGSNGSCGYYCNAQVGYDYVTGLGSPRGYNLITTLVQNKILTSSSK